MKQTDEKNLFSISAKKLAPLAERMRPETLKDFVGQSHIVGQGSVLSRAIKADRVGSCIFWGPPGTGKTTLANIIANSTDSYFEKLNAVASGVSDAKKIIDESKKRLEMYGKKTYLLLDECHRWSKAQSDCVLGAVEQGVILFIGSTTENPYASLTPAIVSRCRVFEFSALGEDDIEKALLKSLDSENGLKNFNVELDRDALKHFVWASGGDLRSAFNALELAVLTTMPEGGKVKIDKATAVDSMQKKALSVDENSYYDMISAFCKSLRGSDDTAALFWFARLISAGCDPMLLARRLVVHSSEDVGNADSLALVVCTSAMTALKNIGMPEARIPLAQAIIYVCRAKKSNDVVTAIGEAFADAQLYADAPVPPHLRDTSFKRNSDQKNAAYLYPHNYDGGWVEQQYLPDVIKDKKYLK